MTLLETADADEGVKEQGYPFSLSITRYYSGNLHPANATVSWRGYQLLPGLQLRNVFPFHMLPWL